MKKHILTTPKKAELWRRQDITINEVTYTMFLYTWGNYNGFVHLAHLYKDFEHIASAKAQYYNRTWEYFTGESVYKEACNFAILSKDITKEIKQAIMECLK